MEFLLHGDESGPADMEEATLLRAYRRVSREDRAHILKVLRALDAEADVAQRLERAQQKK